MKRKLKENATKLNLVFNIVKKKGTINRQNYANFIKFSGNDKAPQIWSPESSANTSTLNMQSGTTSSFPERRAGSVYTC